MCSRCLVANCSFKFGKDPAEHWAGNDYSKGVPPNDEAFAMQIVKNYFPQWQKEFEVQTEEAVKNKKKYSLVELRNMLKRKKGPSSDFKLTAGRTQQDFINFGAEFLMLRCDPDEKITKTVKYAANRKKWDAWLHGRAGEIIREREKKKQEAEDRKREAERKKKEEEENQKAPPVEATEDNLFEFYSQQFELSMHWDEGEVTAQVGV